jgi:hypothetical protein
MRAGLNVGFGLAETLDAVAGLPLAALLEQGHALEALEDIAFDDETAAGGLETGMLGHKSGLVNVVSGLGRVRM